MTVERLVQQVKIERTDIFITADGLGNTVGVEEGRSDTKAGKSTPEDRDDAALEAQVVVVVDIEDDDLADGVRLAFNEFNTMYIAEE